MLNLFLNRNIVLACSADCPADNHARQLAQFLYETLGTIKNKITDENNINYYRSFLYKSSFLSE